MKCLERNKRLFYYADLDPENFTQVIDDDGNETGETTPAYGAKTAMYANISAAAGGAEREWFGVTDDYTRTIVLETDPPFDETAGLWIDNLDADVPDYAVKGIAKSLNGSMVVVRKLI